MVFKKVIRTTKCGLRRQFAPKGTPRTYILLDRKCTFLARAFARAKKVHCTFRCNLPYVRWFRFKTEWPVRCHFSDFSSGLLKNISHITLYVLRCAGSIGVSQKGSILIGFLLWTPEKCPLTRDLDIFEVFGNRKFYYS